MLLFWNRRARSFKAIISQTLRRRTRPLGHQSIQPKHTFIKTALARPALTQHTPIRFKTLIACVLSFQIATSLHAEETSNAVIVPDPMIVSYYNHGASDTRNTYKFELIKYALDITQAEYGDYLIKPYNLDPTPRRQAQLIRQGKQLNLLWASPGTIITESDVIAIPLDILQGLQGFRICLTHKSMPIETDKYHSAAALRHLTFGQGNWSDLSIYHHNQLHPQIAPSFEALFQMLEAKRFQCLPLGINEVGLIYDEKKALYPSLSMDHSLLIYYEFPIYLYVSNKHPKLAERLTLGLERLQANGSFDQLFKRYHAANVARLQLEKRKLLCLKSPYLDNTKQCQKLPALPSI